MHLLCRKALATCIAVMAIGPAMAQKRVVPKLKPDPVRLDDTMAWLNDAIPKAAGFSFAKPATQIQEKLAYEINQADSCHLNWRSVATGDQDLRSLYPGLDQDEDLAAIVPGSIHAQPVDVRDLLEGGTGQPAESGAAPYWKLIAISADPSLNETEPFGILFQDMVTAQHVAAVMEHAVHLCRDIHLPEKETDAGCDASPTLKVVETANTGKESNLGAQHVVFSQTGDFIYFAGHYINQSQKPVSCVAEFTFYAKTGLDKNSKPQVRNSLVTWDLDPGQTANASLGMPHNLGESLHAIHYLCYPRGAVNVLQHSCAELNHPLHWDPKKPRAVAKP